MQRRFEPRLEDTRIYLLLFALQLKLLRTLAAAGIQRDRRIYFNFILAAASLTR